MVHFIYNYTLLQKKGRWFRNLGISPVLALERERERERERELVL